MTYVVINKRTLYFRKWQQDANPAINLKENPEATFKAIANELVMDEKDIVLKDRLFAEFFSIYNLWHQQQEGILKIEGRQMFHHYWISEECLNFKNFLRGVQDKLGNNSDSSFRSMKSKETHPYYHFIVACFFIGSIYSNYVAAAPSVSVNDMILFFESKLRGLEIDPSYGDRSLTRKNKWDTIAQSWLHYSMAQNWLLVAGMFDFSGVEKDTNIGQILSCKVTAKAISLLYSPNEVADISGLSSPFSCKYARGNFVLQVLYNETFRIISEDDVQCISYTDTCLSGEYSQNSFNSNSINNSEYSISLRSPVRTPRTPRKTNRSRPESGVENSGKVKIKKEFVLPDNVIPYRPEVLMLSDEEHCALIQLASEPTNVISAELRVSIEKCVMQRGNAVSDNAVKSDNTDAIDNQFMTANLEFDNFDFDGFDMDPVNNNNNEGFNMNNDMDPVNNNTNEGFNMNNDMDPDNSNNNEGCNMNNFNDSINNNNEGFNMKNDNDLMDDNNNDGNDMNTDMDILNDLFDADMSIDPQLSTMEVKVSSPAPTGFFRRGVAIIRRVLGGRGNRRVAAFEAEPVNAIAIAPAPKNNKRKPNSNQYRANRASVAVLNEDNLSPPRVRARSQSEQTDSVRLLNNQYNRNNMSSSPNQYGNGR